MKPVLSPAAEELAVQIAAIVDETPRVPTSPPLPGPDRRCIKCGRRAL